MKLTLTVEINAPISKTFGVFTDLNQAKDTLSGIKELEMIEGSEKMQVGTKWKETREMMGKDSTEIMWVTALTENKSYSVEAESHGTKYLSTFTFSERDGGTDVAWIFEGIPQSASAKLMSIFAVLFSGSLKKMMQTDLDELKAACEK